MIEYRIEAPFVQMKVAAVPLGHGTKRATQLGFREPTEADLGVVDKQQIVPPKMTSLQVSSLAQDGVLSLNEKAEDINLLESRHFLFLKHILASFLRKL